MMNRNIFRITVLEVEKSKNTELTSGEVFSCCIIPCRRQMGQERMREREGK
jgi:hypothetical protein